NRRPARHAAGLHAGQALVAALHRNSPRDTNRYVRGWAQAANAAGLGPAPVPMVRASETEERSLERLTRQLEFWARRVRALENAGRTHYKGTRKVNGRRRSGPTK